MPYSLEIMEELYRAEPPIDIAELSNSSVPFDLAIESLHYYQVHEKPSKWGPMISTMKKWFDSIQLLRRANLQHTGYDYPDWRQFALLDFAMPTRVLLHTRIDWYNKIDFNYAKDLLDNNTSLLDSDTVISILARIRVGLDQKIDPKHLHVYLFTLIYCKYHLIDSDEQMHNTLLPIYNNLYSKLLVEYNLHPQIFSQNSFWCIHSTLFLFPYEVGKLDRHTFKTREDSIVHSTALVLNQLGDL